MLEHETPGCALSRHLIISLTSPATRQELPAVIFANINTASRLLLKNASTEAPRNLVWTHLAFGLLMKTAGMKEVPSPLNQQAQHLFNTSSTNKIKNKRCSFEII